MDVTPPDGMFKAMQEFVDSTVGDAPLAVETTTAANNRRQARQDAMGFLHNLVRLSMRVGVARYLQERGLPTTMDQVKPNPLKPDRPASDVIQTQ